MKKIKSFFDDKKKDSKFKSGGEGHSLKESEEDKRIQRERYEQAQR